KEEASHSGGLAAKACAAPDEHRRPEHAGLYQVHDGGRSGRRAAARSALAASAGGEGPRAGPDEFLRAARPDRAVAADQFSHASKGMAAEPRGSSEARRAL